MHGNILTAIALGIGLSACCGFRVFIPLLVAAIAANFKWIPVNAGMEWLGTVPAIVCFATAAVLEIAAYYIAFIDNLLDTIAAPLAIIAGTCIAATVLPVAGLDPMLKWVLGLLAGGATAGTIQVGSGLLRLLSSKTTGGMGNGFFATGENLVAMTGSIASLFIPVIIALFLLGICTYLLSRLLRKLVGE
ncbi:DUF4126 domain-containing protein [Flavihumibacter profundi]|uniref:DUF4126 domain-containing protein n=1 Tax=Flavihumibacter profundi TaxID=2716883 RepID=UPI001CC7FFA8|nr:DUF4126 domain-containing protein [Flavihumibacter profundi]MBZ5855684.1 DUF4126 domain-containing protein [Flavihumibacter profundi]